MILPKVIGRKSVPPPGKQSRNMNAKLAAVSRPVSVAQAAKPAASPVSVSVSPELSGLRQAKADFLGSARRWRAVFGGPPITSFHQTFARGRQGRPGHAGSGGSPKPARGPRALPGWRRLVATGGLGTSCPHPQFSDPSRRPTPNSIGTPQSGRSHPPPGVAGCAPASSVLARTKLATSSHAFVPRKFSARARKTTPEGGCAPHSVSEAGARKTARRVWAHSFARPAVPTAHKSRRKG